MEKQRLKQIIQELSMHLRDMDAQALSSQMPKPEVEIEVKSEAPMEMDAAAPMEDEISDEEFEELMKG